MEKFRSTGIRNTPRSGFASTFFARSIIACRNSGTPRPVSAETGIIGAPSRKEPLTISPTSSLTSSIHSSSTRSALLMATRPLLMPIKRHISKCSRVCGITPSSAATTSTTRSMVLAPASMCRTKRSCPGTSMTVMSVPRKAKPRSVVIPRSFSSFRRSGSVPVRALTSADLPWSMWPAVPTTTCN